MSFSEMIPATKADHEEFVSQIRMMSFGTQLADHVVPYASDVIPMENDRGGRNASGWKMVWSAVVQDGWCNVMKNMHGAAAAWIVDTCTSVALIKLSTPSFWGLPMIGGVSLSLDMTYYNPAPIGTKVRIVVTVERMAGTLANTRCDVSGVFWERYDLARQVLYRVEVHFLVECL